MARQSSLGLWDRLLWRVIAPAALLGWIAIRLTPAAARLEISIIAAFLLAFLLSGCLSGSVTVFATDSDPNLSGRIHSVLIDMGYRREHQFHMVSTYVPTWRAGPWAGGLSVSMAGGEAMLQGPRLHLARLLRSLNI